MRTMTAPMEMLVGRVYRRRNNTLAMVFANIDTTTLHYLFGMRFIDERLTPYNDEGRVVSGEQSDLDLVYMYPEMNNYDDLFDHPDFDRMIKDVRVVVKELADHGENVASFLTSIDALIQEVHDRRIYEVHDRSIYNQMFVAQLRDQTSRRERVRPGLRFIRKILSFFGK